MTTVQFLTSGWYWDPFATALVVAITCGCWRLFRRQRDAKPSPPVLLGLALLILSLLSPLATLARSYLFCAHMLQHLLLLLVVPSLLMLGMPTEAEPAERKREAVSLPAGGMWMAGVGGMALWHAPALCDAASVHSLVYHLQVGSLLLMGTLFWWPILGLRAADRLAPLAGVCYLVSACFVCTLMGIYLTFYPASICSIYMQPADSLGIMPLIRQEWGLTHTMDQHVGGLLMWVPGCLIYLSGVIVLLVRWYSESEETFAKPC